jgi:hypothetical protein
VQASVEERGADLLCQDVEQELLMWLGFGVAADHEMAGFVLHASQRVRPGPTGVLHGQSPSKGIESAELGAQGVGVRRVTNGPDHPPVIVKVNALSPATTQ